MPPHAKLAQCFSRRWCRRSRRSSQGHRYAVYLVQVGRFWSASEVAGCWPQGAPAAHLKEMVRRHPRCRAPLLPAVGSALTVAWCKRGDPQHSGIQHKALSPPILSIALLAEKVDCRAM